MDFMSRVVHLNIIYPKANPKREILEGADSDVKFDGDHLITKKKVRRPPEEEFMTLVMAPLLLPARKGSSRSI